MDDVAADGSIVESTRRAGVLRVYRPGTTWLHTGWNGGRVGADAAYNVAVPENWETSDLPTYVEARLDSAGFEDDGPVLLTGVSMDHARGARCGPVMAVATVGLSNPAALPREPTGGSLPTDGERSETTGTVNIHVVTDRALADGALANLVAVAAEAKAVTLLAESGFPGTTSDAITVGHDPNGTLAEYSGSATPVGAATRACVREAVTASLHARYENQGSVPASVDEARYGTTTDVRADVFSVPKSDP
ncbi:adenosylcobinamide amidohydrolase [Halovivax cerinus]|uniref:Adenosylcobinamide amidohydrolase n=1 Tax=Halovivax cerinus TaxID=1487865 RepID=A0ABD5NM72_9EURY|nr:adenosylcobinamide amidohydrolase [Halovivax cerinus]